jgi:hypothetical protein
MRFGLEHDEHPANPDGTDHDGGGSERPHGQDL